MLIKITRTHHRALDPRTTKTFHINDVHEFEDDLAKDFIKNGFAEEHKQLKVKIENKAILEVPEIKSEELIEEEAKEEAEKSTKRKKQQSK